MSFVYEYCTQFKKFGFLFGCCFNLLMQILNFSFVSFHFIRTFQNRYRLTGCKAELNKKIGETDPSNIILKGVHRHAGDARKIGKARAMKKLKDDAKNTRNPSRQVVTNAINGLGKSTLATMASEKSLVKMVNRSRSNQNQPKNPRSVAELNLPDEYRRTIKGDNFLLYDSSNDHGDENRFLIFGTIENLKFLSRCESIYMDGTFSVVPVIFNQLYTIHGTFCIIFLDFD